MSSPDVHDQGQQPRREDKPSEIPEGRTKAGMQSQRGEGSFGTFGRLYRDAAPYFALGIQLAATVVIMFYLGYWADEYFETKPWLMIAGLMLGVSAGLYNFFKTVMELGGKEGKEKD